MKKVFVAMAAVAAMACSCSKEEVKIGETPVKKGVVHISLVDDNGTRATGEGHGSNEGDSRINTLEVFVFNVNEGEVNDGLLDGYKKYTSEELKSLSDLEIKTSTGKKMIYVVANSHKTDWSEGMTKYNFEQQMAYLYKEDVCNFIMFAAKEVNVQLQTSVTMTLTRMISRIKLNSVMVSFAGTPNAGVPLQNVKAYLINVQAQKRLIDGTGANLKVVNYKKYVPEDMEGITMEGLLYDELAESINEATHSQPHYFYCYENSRNQETEVNRFTRLVIEGTLNGITYYYPIPIKDLKRNSCYSIDVKIYRPGSLDPDTDVEIGTLDLTLSIQGWYNLPDSVVEF